MQRRTSGRMLFATLLLALVTTPASATIDMSGRYEAIQFPCHYTFVQTGAALGLSGTCGPQSQPMSGTGTIDSSTGAFTVSGGVITGLCNTFVITGTADGEIFNATYVCDSGSGPVTGTKCLNGILDPGEDCQDGNAVDGDCCSSRCRFEPVGSPCASNLNSCTSDVCDGAGACLHELTTASCDDGNACTVGDVCADGTCVPGAPVSGGECSATQACERTIARTLASCIARVGGRMKRCYLKTGAACPPEDLGTAKNLAKVAAKIGAECSDATMVQALGYGAEATPATVIARVQEACTGEVASIVARTFGGPQAALLAGADPSTTSCLSAASSAALKLVKTEATLRAKCIAKAHGIGNTCDVAGTNAKIVAAEAAASATIGARCSDLEAITGLDAAMYVDRAAAQARCVTAASHGNSGPLALDCGPRGTVAVPPRDTWTKVVLDQATYGTICGDGSPYAFWIRLPPSGKPSEKMAIDLQGGGVCVFEADCVAKSYNLSSATEDTHPTTGIFSTSAADNPFSDWTMVFLPYCTQDDHIGGGVTDVFPSVTVRRFGAINLRTALRYVRDVLWQDLAATEPEGYRPDRLTVIFGGESAGGIGVNYNYHYVLDDLRWAHTTAVPDSGSPLDNGQVLGVQGLGIVAQAETGNLAWGARPYQPPYCLDSTCFIGPVLQAATSSRLKAVAEQQIVNVSNQADGVLSSDEFFPSMAAWINAVRAAYCATQGLNGIRNWFPAQSTPYHTILTVASRWSSVTAASETLPTFLAGAIADPDAVTDHVDEGTLVTDYPGVNPIACLERASASAKSLR
jgi:cysteine-rich repeat protein